MLKELHNSSLDYQQILEYKDENVRINLHRVVICFRGKIIEVGDEHVVLERRDSRRTTVKTSAIVVIAEDEVFGDGPTTNGKPRGRQAIMRYIEYCKSSCDAYAEYHYAMILSLESIATKRNLVLRLKQGSVFPNIWAFMRGESTISRKSVAVMKGKNLLKNYS